MVDNKIIQKIFLCITATALIAEGATAFAAPTSNTALPDAESALSRIFEHDDLSDVDFSAHALSIKFHSFQRDEVSKALHEAPAFLPPGLHGYADRKMAGTTRAAPPLFLRRLQFTAQTGCAVRRD